MSYIPVIGILSLPSEDIEQCYNPNQGYSYFPSSYVKWVQSAGARVVPIPYNISSVLQLDSILEKINGVLLPGGNPTLWQNERQQEGFSNLVWVVKRIYEKAKEFNDNKRYFPIWGTCLGFEMMLMACTEDPKILDVINNSNKSLNTVIRKNEKSDFFHYLPQDIKDYLENAMPMYYNHRYGLLVDSFYSNSKLTDNYKLTAVSSFQNKEFVAVLEGKKYPFILSQFHPEINQIALSLTNSHHDIKSILVALYQANYFISLAKKSPNRYDWQQFLKDGIETYIEKTSFQEEKIIFPQFYVFQASCTNNIPNEYIQNKISIQN